MGGAITAGIQDKFSWNAVVQAAIGGGIGASGFGGKLASKLGAKSGTFTHGFLSGAASSALGQGIGLATGLQSKFDWAGVAGAGVGGGLISKYGDQISGAISGAFAGSKFAGSVGVSAASALANAATRSAIDGSSFGDNLRAAIPDVIGQALGQAAAGGVTAALQDKEAKQSSGELISDLSRYDPETLRNFTDSLALTADNDLYGGADFIQIDQPEEHNDSLLCRLRGLACNHVFEDYAADSLQRFEKGIINNDSFDHFGGLQSESSLRALDLVGAIGGLYFTEMAEHAPETFAF